MDLTKYKTHIFSLNPSLLQANDLSEEQIADSFVNLLKEWDKEKNAFDPERETLFDEERREDISHDLRQKKAIYVVVENTETEQIVGLGELVNETNLTENNGPYLGRAYVLPEHRRKGLLTEITKKLSDAGSKVGYDYIFAEPGDDGKARRVFEKQGFINIGNESDVLLKKNLSPRLPEGQHPHLRR